MTPEMMDKRRRGWFLFPTLITLGNIFCGFYSIIASIERDFGTAALFIVIAVIFDGLDGKVARWAHAESPFGLQLDSLADVVSFGVAPGLLVYGWALNDLGRIGWLSSFLFVICGAMRLARFNVQTGTTDSRYFVGLPIPAGAGMLVSVVLWQPKAVLSMAQASLVLALATLVALLMVSKIRYFSLKKIDFTKRWAVTTLVWVVLVMYLVAIDPQTALLAVATTYTLSGPFGYGMSLVRRRRRSADLTAGEAPPDRRHAESGNHE